MADDAAEAVESLQGMLDGAGIGGELRLIGGSSLPGLLTYGDIDLLLRVPIDDFTQAVRLLVELVEPRRQDLWSDEMALFLIDPNVPVELAVVPVGSAQDRHFVRAWDRLATRAELRERYNALKTAADEDYDARKADFFGAIVAEPDEGSEASAPAPQ